MAGLVDIRDVTRPTPRGFDAGPGPADARATELRGAGGTVARAVSMTGIGLHNGQAVRLTLRPAPAGTGILFRRTDLERAAVVAARFDRVSDTRLCTVLRAPSDPALQVGTVEHLMAALVASGVDDALVEVDGPELPIGDGSSLPFLDLLACAGIARRAAPRRVLTVLRPVRVDGADGAFASLVPADRFALDVSIAFPDGAIGCQSLVLQFDGTVADASRFRAELGWARTFTAARDIAQLREAGLAKGGTLANAVVVDGARVLNPGGLRAADEFVRHKMLDAIGDLALAGAPLRARFVAHRPGHGLNNLLLRTLFAEPGNWRLSGDEPVRTLPAA